jgi:hypothetical protein
MSGALGAARWPTALGVAAPVAGALAAQFWNYLIAALAGLLEHAFSSVSVLGFWACSGNPVGWRVQVRGYLANAYADLERELPAPAHLDSERGSRFEGLTVGILRPLDHHDRDAASAGVACTA